jgi:hypothetical protein
MTNIPIIRLHISVRSFRDILDKEHNVSFYEHMENKNMPLTYTALKSTVFWDAAWRILVEVYRCVSETSVTSTRLSSRMMVFFIAIAMKTSSLKTQI